MRGRGKKNNPTGHSRDKTVIKTQVTSVADIWKGNGNGNGNERNEVGAGVEWARPAQAADIQI